MLLQSFLLFLTVSDVAVECKLVNLIERLKGNWINTTASEVCSIQEKKQEKERKWRSILCLFAIFDCHIRCIVFISGWLAVTAQCNGKRSVMFDCCCLISIPAGLNWINSLLFVRWFEHFSFRSAHKVNILNTMRMHSDSTVWINADATWFRIMIS